MSDLEKRLRDSGHWDAADEIERLQSKLDSCEKVINALNETIVDFDKQLSANGREINLLLSRLGSVRHLVAAMADQRLFAEMSKDDLADADFESAYDTFVENARELYRALYATAVEERGTGAESAHPVHLFGGWHEEQK